MIKGGKGKLAETQSGMDWLSNCLHPPTGRTPNRPVKDQPDLSAQASVCLHYPIINEQPINPMSLDAVPVIKYSKYLYIMTNSPLYDFIVLRITPQGTPELKVGGGYPIFYEAGTTRNPNLSLESMANNMESYRLIGRSTTFTQDSMSVNNNTMLYGAKIRPNIGIYTTAVIVNQRNPFHERFHKHIGYDQIVKQHFSPSARKTVKVGDDDFCHIAGQFKNKLKVSDDDTPEVGTPSIGNSIQVFSLGPYTFNGGDIIARNPGKSVTWKADKGAFMIQHQTEPINSYTSVIRSYTSEANSTPATGYGVLSFAEFQAQGLWYLIQFPTSIAGNHAGGPFDVPWNNFQFGLVLHDFAAGLPSTTAPTQLTYPIAPMKTETNINIAFQPAPSSVLSSCIRDAPVYDPLALERRAQISNSQPDMLEAKDNFLGGLAAMAGKILPKLFQFAPEIGNLVGNIAGGRSKKEPMPKTSGLKNLRVPADAEAEPRSQSRGRSRTRSNSRGRSSSRSSSVASMRSNSRTRSKSPAMRQSRSKSISRGVNSRSHSRIRKVQGNYRTGRYV